MRQINQAGLDLIKSFEGCKLEAYYDIVGILTVGYGHTGDDVSDGMTITQDEADALLRNDLSKFEQRVENWVPSDITDNQFAALVSFAYNLGLGSLQHSTLLKDVIAGDIDAAAAQFLNWDHAGGVVVEGLLRRREAEKELFIT